MEYLFCVDVQPEFAKDRKGKDTYNRLLKFIQKVSPFYTVIAPVYLNKTNPNMHRLVGWNEMKEISNLEFRYDYLYYHSGYSITEYPKFQPGDKVVIVGFDTDACVLSTCFDLFNLGVNFKILVDGCWSSGGKYAHKAGLTVMQRQFKRAVDVTTKLEDLY